MLSGPHILYQPHVHQAEGVLSPDVLIKDLSAVMPGGGEAAVSVFRLTTAVKVPEYIAQTVWSPAVAIVAASRGPILAPACVHAMKAVVDQDPALALQAASKPIGRSAVRLSADECALADVSLHSAGQTMELAVLAARAEGLKKGQASLVALGGWQTMGAAPITVSLKAKQGYEVSHSYTVQSLGSGESS